MSLKSVGQHMRAWFNYDADEVSVETGLCCEDKSLAVQSQAAEADINTIVKTFSRTGQIPPAFRLPLEQDFEDIVDFHTAQNAIAEARSSFNLLPAAIRARFDNDPAYFYDYCVDPDNLPELVKLGLAPAPDPETGEVQGKGTPPIVGPGASQEVGSPVQEAAKAPGTVQT